MFYPFCKGCSILKRQFTLFLAVILVFSFALAGCKRVDVADDTSAPLVDSSLPTIAESTAATEPQQPTSTPDGPSQSAVGDNIAIVKEQVNTRSSPSMDGPVITQLDAGDQVEIDRVVNYRGKYWAHIPELGWVSTEFLDMTNVSTELGGGGGAGGGSDTPAQPTTPSVPEPTTPSGGNNSGNGTKGVVTGSDLNIRSEASTSGDIVGHLTYGDRVTILEKSNGWGRVSQGWISLTYVYIDGETGNNPCKGLVTGSQLNVRQGPGTDYDIATTLSKGDRVQVLEQIKVGNTSWGCTKDGWICLDYIYVDGTTGEGSGTGTVTGDAVNVRSGPGTNYDVVGTLKSGDTVKIFAQFTFGDMTWGCIDNGWVSMSYVGAG